MAATVFVLCSAAPAAAAAKQAPTWDTRLEPIARAVERLRGLEFTRPVEVEYLDDAEFERRVGSEGGELTKAERTATDRSEAQLRAIGLIGADVDLVSATSDLQEAGVLAYYLPASKLITVRGTELDAATKVTLAHELTHALDDQHFDLDKLDRKARKAHADSSLTALIEGDAVQVQRAYADTLSERERDEYSSRQRRASSAFADELATAAVPSALRAWFQSFYTLGPEMVRFASAVDGEDAVDDLFAAPPRSELAFLDPATVVDRVAPLRVPLPEHGTGEARVGRPDSFGAFALYLMLSTAMDPVDAFRAVQGWGGDSMVTFSRGAQTCVRATFTGRDGEASTRLRKALEHWVADGVHPSSTVTARGPLTTLTACDEGGTSVDPGDAPMRALVTVELRSVLLSQVTELASPAVGVCAADAALRSQSFAAVRNAAAASPSAEPAADVFGPFQRAFLGIVTDCRGGS